MLLEDLIYKQTSFYHNSSLFYVFKTISNIYIEWYIVFNVVQIGIIFHRHLRLMLCHCTMNLPLLRKKNEKARTEVWYHLLPRSCFLLHIIIIIIVYVCLVVQIYSVNFNICRHSFECSKSRHCVTMPSYREGAEITNKYEFRPRSFFMNIDLTLDRLKLFIVEY